MSAELHVHIEGTLEPELIFTLAERNGIVLPYRIEELRARYEFENLQSFLDLYYENMGVLRTAADFADLARAYFARAAAAGVRHVELFFDPQAHSSRGVDLHEVYDGLFDAIAASEREFGLSSAAIACIVRDRPVAEANALVEQIIRDQVPVIGIGLDSAEVGYPPSLFVDAFAKARAAGLHVVAHAGEEAGPEYVWQALDLLKVERVDHGLRAIEDEALVARMVNERIPVTLCPLSNVRLKAVRALAEHPLHRILERGIVATINSDDPAYFGGYLDTVVARLQREAGITDAEIAVLQRNSIEASFLSDARKAELLADQA